MSSDEQRQVVVGPDGVVRFVWSDDLADLAELGPADVRRASHVEPAAGGGWTADLSPSGGPTLGPYRLRSAAVAAEVAWIEQQLAGG